MTTQLAERVDLEHLPCHLDEGVGGRAAIGVVVLATDQTLEHEFRTLLKVPGVAFYESRISNDYAITPDTLKAMEGRIAAATDLILPDVRLDVVAFGCTSASMVIGEERVFELLRTARPEVACTTPITAALAALRSMQAKRIALLTPYRADINHFIRGYIEARGFEVPVMGSFNEEDDRRAARIDLPSIRRAGVDLLERPRVDALFVSCTNLRFAQAVGEIEDLTGKPATSSNHALAWHCLRLGGIAERFPEHGSLYEMDLP